MEFTDVDYCFRTIDQSVAYKLTASDIVVTYRKGFARSVQTIPTRVIQCRQSNWETTSNFWFLVVFVSALAVVGGGWGISDPQSTGMHLLVAVCLVLSGCLMPYLLWNHRKLSGVTFSSNSDYSLSIIAHAVPTPQFHAFVLAMENRILAESGSD